MGKKETSINGIKIVTYGLNKEQHNIVVRLVTEDICEIDGYAFWKLGENNGYAVLKFGECVEIDERNLESQYYEALDADEKDYAEFLNLGFTKGAKMYELSFQGEFDEIRHTIGEVIVI